MVPTSSASMQIAVSSESANYLQVPGRIGDACVAGGASYADSTVGGCGSTGDGDLHLRFQPCYQVPVADVASCWVHNVPPTQCIINAPNSLA